MRVFLAGASGVIGTRLVPLLIGGGHQVTGMTRVPPPPRIHVDEAARATVELLDAPSGIVEIVEADG